MQQRGNERRALDDRKAALMASAIAPGSVLSCLDELAGEAVEAACEKAVFASPEAVASAVRYVSAQLALLIDGTAYVARGDAAYAPELVPLRTAIELDRFGLVAQVLKERDGCTVERCDALAQLSDSTRVRDNLHERTFEEQVKKYTAIWNAPRPTTDVVAAAGLTVPLRGTSGLETAASRDPAATEPASAAVAPPGAQGSVTSPPRAPPPLRDPAVVEPVSQSAAVTPSAALESVASPPQEPLALRGNVTPTPQETAAEPPSQSAAITPPAALGSITPLPRRRPRIATPRATAPP
jgi:hypothetical protein